MKNENSILLDRHIREPLFDFLEGTFGQVRILEEKTMGKSRADVVMVTRDSICGIEIKSDADTYSRLARQIKDYDKYYDYNYAVVGSSHAYHVHEHLPDYWGIITVELVEGEPDFYILRRASSNPKVIWKRKAQILWKMELAHIQEELGMPKYRDRSKDFIVGNILERIEAGKIEESQFRALVSRELFERDYTKVEEKLAEFGRSEIEKQLELEDDPEKRAALIRRRETARRNLPAPRRKRRRRK